MQMQHHFTVPVPVDVAWKALLDPERVAPCMPGAKLTKVEGNEFSGSVKVKLGPVTLLYKGTGTFKEVDEANHRAVIDASGKDSRGNGTAAATVTAVLTPEGSSTKVTVDTDLKITGKPAQLGRGLIAEVGGKILNQFAECLAEKLTGEEEPAEAAAGKTAEPEKAAQAEEASAEAKPAATQAAREEEQPSWRVAPVGAADGEREVVAEKAGSVSPGKTAPADEAIDLLGTAGTPVLKRVASIAGAVIALLLVVRALRRKRRR